MVGGRLCALVMLAGLAACSGKSLGGDAGAGGVGAAGGGAAGAGIARAGGRAGTGGAGTGNGGAGALGGGVGGAGGAGGRAIGTGNGGAGAGGSGTGTGTGGTGTGGGIAGATGAGGSTGGAGGGSAGGAGGGAGAGAGGGACETSLGGVVYDPAGRLPLYNVVVYVPTATPAALTDGITCALACPSLSSSSVAAAALTDTSGAFTLRGVPPGTNIPLVIEIGKWRRQVTIPSVPACVETKLTADLTRLPRNQTEGHLPRIAVATGHADALECLLRNIGIADEEFTNDAGSGRVNLFAGGAGMTSEEGAVQSVSGQSFLDAYATLFANPAKLAGYDSVLLACESSQLETDKDLYLANLKGYADGGGHLFLEHFQDYWIRKGPAPWPTTATWAASVQPDPPSPITASVNLNFPKGVALADWLFLVGASPTRGQLSLTMAEHSVDMPVAAATSVWVSTTNPVTLPALSFYTPVEVAPAAQCGRVDFADMHVATGAGVSHPDVPFPSGCQTPDPPLPQHDLWEFLFFDGSSCINFGGIKSGPPVSTPP
jgi:hypothetical protein